MVPVWAGHLGAQAILMKPFAILMAACVVLLIMVCANASNLLLSRAVSRPKEIWTEAGVRRREEPADPASASENVLLAAWGWKRILYRRCGGNPSRS